eukprot:5804306-Pyramimonas_sp.AAC.1
MKSSLLQDLRIVAEFVPQHSQPVLHDETSHKADHALLSVLEHYQPDADLLVSDELRGRCSTTAP